ncbi:MAG: hypothetical protein AABY22_29100 [Nanoarchaeota archaeon]
MNKKQSISGQKINHLTLINRIHVLEGIIFDLRNALQETCNKPTTNSTYHGLKILKKYNKSWEELYEEIDKKFDYIDEKVIEKIEKL